MCFIAADLLQTRNAQSNTAELQSADESGLLTLPAQILMSSSERDQLKASVKLTLDDVDEEDTVEELVFQHRIFCHSKNTFV